MYKKVIMICFLVFLTLGCQAAESSKEQNGEKETSTEMEMPNDSEVADDDEESETGSSKGEDPILPEQGEMIVDYIDVGQGDATLIRYKDKQETYTILYDTGDWLGNEVVPFLQQRDIDYIDLVMISHPHADHIGQLEKVMHAFDVGEVWMTGNSANSEVFQKALQAVLDSDADYDEPEAGAVYDIGALTITILHPETLTGDLNEDSLSFHLAYGDVSFLFTGDAGKNEEQIMLQSDLPLEADYIQLGHHGSNTSSAEAFIDAVHPSVAIYSAGKDNSYGHPHEEVVSLLEKKGITIYGTDNFGTITVMTDGKTAKAQTEKRKAVKEQAEKEQSKVNQSNELTENNNNAPENCIDINKASVSQLIHIIHIGEARAEEIIAKRPFQSVDGLIHIKGIGDKRLQDMKQEKIACIGGDN